MSSIDERVVEMRFNNSQFQKGVADTNKSLSDLKSGLKLDGATKGLEGINSAAKGVDLSGIAAGVENISSKFSVLGAIGFSVLQRLTNSAIDFGKGMIGKVIDPIITGGQNRARNIEQAKFQFKGLGMDVEKTMASANEAVLGTAYGLDEAAVAASQFGASGLEAGDEMTKALRAISGTAAMTGSSYGDISQVFTTVAGNGRLMASELNRLSGRGVNAAATLGKSMGKTEKEIRDMTSKGQISFEMFYTAMDEAFGEHATKANETYTGSLSNLRAALGRVSADYYTAKFESLRKVFNGFTPVVNSVNSALKPLTKSLATIMNINANRLVSWMEKLDFTNLEIAVPPLVGAMENVLEAFESVMRPIKEAFKDIFPPATAADVMRIVVGIREFTKTLILSKEAGESLRRTFRGVFAVFDIIGMIVSGLVGVLADLFKSIFGGVDGVLAFTGGIGDWLVAVRDAIKEGEGLSRFFETLSTVLQKPIEWIKTLAGYIGNLFSDISESTGRATEGFKPLQAIGEFLMGMFTGLWDVLKSVFNFLQPLASMVGSFIGDWAKEVGSALGNLDFDKVLSLINTGLFAGLVILFKNFLGGGWLEQLKNAFGREDAGDGLVASIKGIFGSLTDTLSAMQSNLKAGTLMKIAIAIGILTISIMALSEIDAAGLGKALGAITVMFLQLSLAMALIGGIGPTKGFFRLPLIAGSLILLSTAIVILASAVRILSTVEWEGLAKGLIGVGALLGALGLFTSLVKVNAGGVLYGAGLILLATAIRILAGAVEKFAEMSWGDIARGLTTLGGVLTMLGLFSSLTKGGGGLILSAIGITIMSGALLILTDVLKSMAEMDWVDIGKSMVVLAGSLAILAGGMYIMTGAIPGALALLVAAAALKVLTPALKDMGDMSWGQIARGMTALAGSLLIMAVGLTAMMVALPGAIALTVASVALALFVPVLKDLGSMKWSTIWRGLGALAAALGLLAIAGVLILPAIPGLLLLGTAITLIGVGTLAAGIGITMLAAGLAALAISGGAAIGVLIGLIRGLLDLLPYAFEQMGLAVVAFIEALAANQVAIIEGFTSIGVAILIAIQKMTPEIVRTLVGLIFLLVETIASNTYRFVDAGLKITVGFLLGIAANIGDVVTAGVDVIVAFLQGIQDNQGRVIDEGWNTVIGFVNSVTDSIEGRLPELQAAGGRMAMAIADGMTFGLASKAASVAQSAWEMGKNAIASIKSAIDSNSPSKESMYLGQDLGDGFALGVDKRVSSVEKSSAKMGNSALGSMRTAISGLASIMDAEMDATPTITPVLDLSNIRKDAGLISGMMDVDPVRSRSRASSISEDRASLLDQLSIKSEEKKTPSIEFTQINNSPKSLTTSEIYRQTRNQISQMKEVVDAN